MMSLYPTPATRKHGGLSFFVPFAVLGDPDRVTSLALIRAMIDGGADALELGLPFSDPPADGPIIQAAGNRALAAGISIDDCFGILTDVRSQTSISIGLLVYFNLVLQRGIDQFYADCARCGVNSVLIADLPLEHFDEVTEIATKHGIEVVSIISDVTSDERLRKIAERTTGYLYLVSYRGVTGATDQVIDQYITDRMQHVRTITDIPVFVGFGISTPAQAQAMAQAGADGVIVGSRIIKEFPDTDAVHHLCEQFSEVIHRE